MNTRVVNETIRRVTSQLEQLGKLDGGTSAPLSESARQKIAAKKGAVDLLDPVFTPVQGPGGARQVNPAALRESIMEQLRALPAADNQAVTIAQKIDLDRRSVQENVTSLREYAATRSETVQTQLQIVVLMAGDDPGASAVRRLEKAIAEHGLDRADVRRFLVQHHASLPAERKNADAFAAAFRAYFEPNSALVTKNVRRHLLGAKLWWAVGSLPSTKEAVRLLQGGLASKAISAKEYDAALARGYLASLRKAAVPVAAHLEKLIGKENLPSRKEIDAATAGGVRAKLEPSGIHGGKEGDAELVADLDYIRTHRQLFTERELTKGLTALFGHLFAYSDRVHDDFSFSRTGIEQATLVLEHADQILREPKSKAQLHAAATKATVAMLEKFKEGRGHPDGACELHRFATTSPVFSEKERKSLEGLALDAMKATAPNLPFRIANHWELDPSFFSALQTFQALGAAPREQVVGAFESLAAQAAEFAAKASDAFYADNLAQVQRRIRLLGALGVKVPYNENPVGPRYGQVSLADVLRSDDPATAAFATRILEQLPAKGVVGEGDIQRAAEAAAKATIAAASTTPPSAKTLQGWADELYAAIAKATGFPFRSFPLRLE